MRQRLLLGIDEAGRGCVIGPLIMAGFLIPEDESLLDRLNDLGVKDSKLLLSKKREELAYNVKKIAHGHKVLKIRPRLLDKFSLNDLEIQFSAQLINHFLPYCVYLDVPVSGRGIKRYCDNISCLCRHKKTKLFGANRMDNTNVLVAASSILAKCEREREITKLKKKYGDFGSGYPADPRTIAWLKWWRKSKGEWPRIVRTKWTTLTKIKY